jgi:hypothetical protein
MCYLTDSGHGFPAMPLRASAQWAADYLEAGLCSV